MREILLATRNKGKVREINDFFRGTQVRFVGIDSFGEVPEIEEDGDTYRDNAYKKAKTLYDLTGMVTLSEDSGLEVDALDGRPGIFSNRFAGESATYEENIRKLLDALYNIPDNRRGAGFISVFCLIDNGKTDFFEGEVRGFITREPAGRAGFGYDPVFVPDGYARTFAELGEGVKNEISHRADALRKLKSFLAGQS